MLSRYSSLFLALSAIIYSVSAPSHAQSVQQPHSQAMLNAPYADKSLTNAMQILNHQNPEDIRNILQSVRNLNAVDRYGNTVLHYAAMNSRYDLIDILIEHNVNIHHKNNRGLTAMDIARDVALNGGTDQTMNIQSYSALEASNQIASAEKAVATSMEAKAPAAGGVGIAASSLAWIGGGTAAAAAGVGTAVVLSDEDDDENDAPSPSAPPPPPAEGAEGFETSEYEAMNTLGNINASSAYARGYTGAGITVAVIDSGIDMDHPDLAGNIDTVNAYDFTEDDNTPDDTVGHGTHVAGTIAAIKNDSGMHGVAYGATIMPLKAGDLFILHYNEATDYAVANGARVINMSYGGTAVEAERQTIQNALDSDVLIAAATGNEGASQAGYPARYAGEADVNNSGKTGMIIAVGATDEDNNRAVFSNACGDAMNYCLFAPGTNVNSTVPDDTYDVYQGTSMASPHVAGAAAVVMEMWPALNAREIGDILLTTATDLGAPGVDNIFGHGLLNLNAATQPVGATSIPDASGDTGSGLTLSGSTLNLGAAFGDAIVSGSNSFAIVDSFNRDFQMNLRDISQMSASFDMNRSMERLASPLLSETLTLSDSTNISFSGVQANQDTDHFTGQGEFSTTNPEDANNEEDNFHASFSHTTGSHTIGLHHNVPVDQAFGIGALPNHKSENHIGEAVGNNPYMGFTDSGMAFTQKTTLSKGIDLRFASYDGKDAITDEKSSGYAMEMVYRAQDQWRTSVQMGVLNEQNAFLGSQTGGAFATDESIATYYTTLGASYAPAKDIELFATGSYGFSFPNAADNAILQNYSQIESSSFSMGAALYSVMQSEDSLTFSVSQPLRVEKGSASLIAASHQNLDGSLHMSTQGVTLMPTGREIDIEMNYQMAFEEHNTSVNLNAMYRSEPNHIEDAADEGVFMMKAKKSF